MPNRYFPQNLDSLPSHFAKLAGDVGPKSLKKTNPSHMRML
jgi:hypothetical protein